MGFSALNNREETIEKIKKNAEVYPDSITVQDSQGYSLLHHACDTGMGLEVGKIVANVNSRAFLIRDKKGRVPLHRACISISSAANFNFYIVHELVRFCPHAIYIEDNLGLTPFQYLP